MKLVMTIMINVMEIINNVTIKYVHVKVDLFIIVKLKNVKKYLIMVMIVLLMEFVIQNKNVEVIQNAHVLMDMNIMKMKKYVKKLLIMKNLVMINMIFVEKI